MVKLVLAKQTMLVVLGFCVGVTCAMTPVALAQPNFTIYIPRKSSPFPQIGAVKASFTVRFPINRHAPHAPLGITVMDGTGLKQSFQPIPWNSTQTQTLTFPIGDPNGDIVSVQLVSNVYQMEITLRTDSDINCNVNQGITFPKTYTVFVGAFGPQNISLQSYDGRDRLSSNNSCTSTAINSCTNSRFYSYRIPEPLDCPTDYVATLASPPEQHQPTANGSATHSNRQSTVDGGPILPGRGAGAKTAQLRTTKTDPLDLRDVVNVQRPSATTAQHMSPLGEQ
jgi:hypothetical protein